MQKKIFNLINLFFFLVSLIYILIIIDNNYDYLKINLVEIGYANILILSVLAILVIFGVLAFGTISWMYM